MKKSFGFCFMQEIIIIFLIQLKSALKFQIYLVKAVNFDLHFFMYILKAILFIVVVVVVQFFSQTKRVIMCTQLHEIKIIIIIL